MMMMLFFNDQFLQPLESSMLQVLGMVRNCVRGIHRHRYSIAPGFVGSLLQYISIIFLLVPKLIIICVALLNSIYWHPILIVTNLAVCYFILGGLRRNNINIFDAIMGLYAPAYHKLDRDEGVDCSDKHKINDIKNWCSAIVIQIFTVAVFFQWDISLDWIFSSLRLT